MSTAIPELANIDPFTMTLEVIIRSCRRSDLRALEWFGMFTHDRAIIESTMERQMRGEAIMLVAEVNGFPAGQLWIDLTRQEVDATAVFWAGRVFPILQGLGIGTRLFDAGERILRCRGFRQVELVVDRTNPAAKRLYERLGYCEIADERDPAEATYRWRMRKDLTGVDQEINTHRQTEGARHG